MLSTSVSVELQEERKDIWDVEHNIYKTRGLNRLFFNIGWNIKSINMEDVRILDPVKRSWAEVSVSSFQKR